MSNDWFRNRNWNDAIAREFDEKLRRARRKEQYLRIQASTLARTHPDIALQLLDRYFQLPDDFDHAQAHVDRATALQALRRIEDAADAYEAALERELVFPNLRTQAYLEFPMLVATQRLARRYNRALAVLRAHVDKPVFPVDKFLWHAAHALILSATGNSTAASTYAVQALDAAALDKSGFRHHPNVGLVTEKHRELIKTLSGVSAA
jgi:tetratricopeptide (TPR) repeat protein